MYSKFFHLFLLASLLLGSTLATQAQSPCQTVFSYGQTGQNRIYFNAVASNSITAMYVWEITDVVAGVTQTITQSSPILEYTFAGASDNHHVCVSMYDTSYACQTGSFCQLVSVDSNFVGSNCTASFNYTTSGSTVSFNASSSSAFPSAYEWEFINTSTGSRTTVVETGSTLTYDFLGGTNYDLVCLTVYDSLNACQASSCDSLYVSGNTNGSNCSAYFVAVDSGNAVSLFASSMGAVGTAYTWEITDHSTGLTTVRTNTFGAFDYIYLDSIVDLDICLTVFDSLTNCTAVHCDSFYAVGSGVQSNNCSAYFVAVDSGNAVSLFASSMGAVGTAYTWEITDHSTGLTTVQTNTFGAFDYIYLDSIVDLDICLTVFDSLTNCTAVHCDSFYAVGSGSSVDTLSNCPNNTVSLVFNHDLYAQEISWAVRDAFGVVVYSGISNNSMNSRTITEMLCLPTGCYTLSVYDSYGDGMCCLYGNGSYQLFDNGGTLLAAGGNFDYYDSRSFCVGGASDPCGYLHNLSINSTVRANGYVDFSASVPNNQHTLVYRWIVDGDSSNVLTGDNPTINLSNGSHLIELEIYDTLNACQKIVWDSIYITNAAAQTCAGVVPSMNVFQDSLNSNVLYIQPVLNNVPANAGFDFYWEFGDSTGGQGNVATHAYNTSGVYNICYWAIDSLSGCVVEYCDSIHVAPIYPAYFMPYKQKVTVNILSPIINHTLSVSSLTPAAWNVELFPNPVHDVVNLRINTSKTINAQVSILAVTGQVVHQQTFEQTEGAGQLQLSVDKLPNGVYFVRFDSDKEQQTLKFIKQ